MREGTGSEREAALADAMLLFSRTKRDLFQETFRHPCSSLHALSRYTKISPATGKYHLDLLMRGRLLSEFALGYKRLFYPSGLLEPDQLEMLAAMQERRIRHMYEIVMQNPGITQSEAARTLGRSRQSVIRCVQRLMGLGCIRAAREGRHSRYFLQDSVGDPLRLRRTCPRSFRERFIQSLKRSGFRTRGVHRSSADVLIVSMEAGSETIVLNLESRSPFWAIQ